MNYLILIIMIFVMLEYKYEPSINWDSETKKLMLWYNFENTRKFIQL